MSSEHSFGCACGAHHQAEPPDPHGQRRGDQVSLTGRLVCHSVGEMLAVLEHAPGHIAASRAEPGCLRFDLTATEDPMIWAVAELFESPAAYRSHQARTADSDWGRATAGIARRDFDRRGRDGDPVA